MNIQTSKGFTIVEVLVSMVILAIGVLGLGVMQITSLQNTQGGQMRSQATILAYDMIDTMRTNSPSVTSGAYNIGFADETPAATECYGAEANCTSAEMATSDINHWRTSLAASLPSGNGFIAAGDAGTTNRVSVIITWIDPYAADQGSERVTIQSELSK